MVTDTSEAALETLFCWTLTGTDWTPRVSGMPSVVAESTAPYVGAG